MIIEGNRRADELAKGAAEIGNRMIGCQYEAKRVWVNNEEYRRDNIRKYIKVRLLKDHNKNVIHGSKYNNFESFYEGTFDCVMDNRNDNLGNLQRLYMRLMVNGLAVPGKKCEDWLNAWNNEKINFWTIYTRIMFPTPE